MMVLERVQQGDMGEAVARWQQALNEQGFSLEVDGIFGPLTAQATRTFQRWEGLEEDGIVGPDTWTRMALRPPATGQEMRSAPPPAGFVYSQDGEFMLDGTRFRFIGVNTRGLVHYGNGDPSDPFLRHTHPEHRTTQLAEAQRMGARVVRVTLAYRSSTTEQVKERLAELLRLAHQYDLYILPAFMDVHHDTQLYPAGEEERYTVEAHVRMLGTGFYEKGYRKRYLPFVREIVSTFRDVPRIFAWELGNEFKPFAGPQGPFYPQLFIEFAHHMADEIHELDSQHLITTGIISTANLACLPDQARALYRHPHLDFLTVHTYDGEGTGDDHLLAQELGKPLIVEEIGFSGPDRVERVKEALALWLEQREARGFMQWGFMATSEDIGDGAHGRGMDPVLPSNKKYWDGLFQAYQERANRLKTG